MKNKILNNLPLKIIAVFAAILLWFVVVNIDDPVVSKSFANIPVQIKNDSLIKNNGQTYQVLNDSQTVKVVVNAKRSIIDRIRPNDIVASADMNNRTQDLVPISISLRRFEGRYESASCDPRNLQIKIEQEASNKFPIKVTTEGTPRGGYVYSDESTADPDTVQISGPKSVVDRIDKAEAKVDISGKSSDERVKAELVLYDSAENIIDQTQLINNIGNEGLWVNVVFLKTKVLTINIDTSGLSAKSGYNISGVVSEPQEIRVAGSEKDLESIDDLSIPSYALNVGELSKRTEVTVDNINRFLQTGLELADKTQKSIVVTILVDKDGTRTFDIPLGSIIVSNIQDGLLANYSKVGIIEFTVVGASNLLDKYANQENKQVVLNLLQYSEPGEYKVPLDIKLPKGLKLDDKKYIKVNIEKAEDNSTED